MEGWVDEGNKNDVQMYSKREEGSVGILMERIIDIPVEIFLIILTEMDLYTELISDIKESREEKYFALNHKIGYCLYDMPILSCRETYYEGIGYSRLNHNNTIFSYSQSISNQP
jgi:hypothetical protein